jgi:5-hydroxyisourate hydrolase-like protein (transthyretin family)
MISTQVIDTTLGRPAANVPVILDLFVTGHGWHELSRRTSDADGIVENFAETPAAGIYRLTYDIAAYQPDPFFPAINVTFDVNNADDDCHLALHLSRFGYAVSRG